MLLCRLYWSTILFYVGLQGFYAILQILCWFTELLYAALKGLMLRYRYTLCNPAHYAGLLHATLQIMLVYKTSLCCLAGFDATLLIYFMLPCIFSAGIQNYFMLPCSVWCCFTSVLCFCLLLLICRLLPAFRLLSCFHADYFSFPSRRLDILIDLLVLVY